ncbi:4-hydroxy-tetrahydrodipicolinate reductase [Pseudemcibacter aquimaris]|uniref:4-hydroxy-tetrahydrodipicolinate reductase n=1 Tax=Pseudemcibacter aquimaris TaxID=2857064 RepID=UPI0020110ECD|nr:4-hydroxy-tetrahydrodipicolinate reductase [Pseudemcibacter aquimaris]MCC3861034.1 4-hydroxy-tetrahydrodipicolinate reductase [Pseudemcibacter aquimaris]
MSRVKIGIIGCMGRMGKALTAAVLDSEKAFLVGATVRAGHNAVGSNLKHPETGAVTNIKITEDVKEVIEKSDVILDFTSPEMTLEVAEMAAKSNASLVIGTTGLSKDDENLLQDISSKIAIVYSSNYSAGVNLMMHLTKLAASTLDENFDIEIVEMHHRHKVDAPSGTALSIGHAAAEGRGKKLDDVMDAGRNGITSERKKGDIGFAVLRGGNVAGEHTVSFNADDERIEITHKAGDRAIFARGAVKAALWLTNKDVGLYDMCDVLGLKA